jgi:PTH1 family peptidyl-tRNA hydrolase
MKRLVPRKDGPELEQGKEMKLIVGLGNPGPEYARTRHNVGFQCLDYIAARHNISFDKKNMKAIWGKGSVAGKDVILAKPQTFMNLSGQSVGEIVRFFKLDPKQDLLVIYDDLDLPVGKLRLRPNGSSGGQNGLRNIIDLLGTPDIQRLRVGIGRPRQGTARDRVLNDFSKEEQVVMDQIYSRVEQAVLIWLTEGMIPAMDRFNAAEK